eukprot:TRINITY_DN8743_c0_g1_i1.p1 TRINITY_DN8743_c0_g1~~TRINITY_DN8743_c0_g1_i1.p1  ORF type:complete len:251 (+),score=42.66 TRINITY_DN8743_c0_g1_i1:96-848(+)
MFARDFNITMGFPGVERGRSTMPESFRMPSRTPSPSSVPFDLAMLKKAAATRATNDCGEGPSTPRGAAMPTVAPESGQEAASRLVFCLEERGLPALPNRGWRTPDPSPTRSGLPKCAAYTAVILNGTDQERTTAPPSKTTTPPSVHSNDFQDGPIFPPHDGGHAWADMVDDFSVGNMTPDAEDREMRNAASLGSVGHPYTCSEACKYVKKGRGCKDGANCVRCHLCEWKKKETRPKPLKPGMTNRGSISR